jgi:hypothetical protein
VRTDCAGVEDKAKLDLGVCRPLRQTHILARAVAPAARVNQVSRLVLAALGLGSQVVKVQVRAALGRVTLTVSAAPTVASLDRSDCHYTKAFLEAFTVRAGVVGCAVAHIRYPLHAICHSRYSENIGES